MTGIDTLLRETLGLAVGSVGPRVIEAAVRARMAATGCDTEAGYLLRLRVDPAERGQLTEAVVVPETWFFRYPESFTQLVALVQSRRADLSPATPFRVLCVPCSTGEEPYSVALTLDRAGLTGLFRVEAVDVSLKAVAATRAATYPATAFREAGPVPGRDAFTPLPGGRYGVPAAVSSAVHARVGNLAAPGFLAGEKPFDAIFCRNLFIYLTDEARRSAAARFRHLLAPGGRLFLGHAEALGLTDPRFRPDGPPQAFMFRVADAPPPEPTPSPPPPPPPPPTLPARLPPVLDLPTPASLPTPVAPGDALSTARTRLDAGRAADALDALTAHLHDVPTAHGYTLLGVAHSMLGRAAEAERAFTQALYLDPGHYDALVQLLALAQARGDAAGAANFRRRADKAHAADAARPGGRR